VNPCEEYGVSKKHRKYDVSFQGTDYSFCAMVFETLGAVNEEGETVLKQLFRFAAKQLGREFSSFCGRAWARVSCSLQRSVAQAILNRTDGQRAAPVFEEPPVGEPVPLVRSPLVGEPPEIPPCPFSYEPIAHECVDRPRALSCESEKENLQVGPQNLVGGPQEKGEREGGGEDGGGGAGVSVVSVCSGGSIRVKKATPINSKNSINSKKNSKDREVGRGGRKTSPDNTNTLFLNHINPCSTPVVSVLPYSRRSPHYNTTLVSHTITPDTHAGESCGATDNPNEAAYGLHKCRSAGVILGAEGAEKMLI